MAFFYAAQAAAHALQAAAHFLQQSCAESFSHSAAQALQMSAHNLQIAVQKDESRAQKRAHKAQMSAQSRQRLIHFKWSLLTKPIHMVAQLSHSTIHAKQASIQAFMFVFMINIKFKKIKNKYAVLIVNTPPLIFILFSCISATAW